MDPLVQLRRWIDEPDETTYTDTELSSRLADTQSAPVVARDVWREKAAAAASLANVSEGGSSRSLNQIYQNALSQLAYWETQTATGGAPSGAVLRKVVRT